MPEIKNCPGCGKLYMEIGRKLCADCYDQELRDEDTVAAYLREAGRASLEQICQDTGVKEAVVLRMIRRGRITGGVSYPCEACGRPIEAGRYCPACANQLQQELSALQAANKPAEPKTEAARARDRMHMLR